MPRSADTRNEAPLNRLARPEKLLLKDFLRVSARSGPSGRALEERLILSLTLASRAVRRPC